MTQGRERLVTPSTDTVVAQPLGLPEELVLMLLNEESGYFHQVPGWHLNCAVIGAVLAELSLRSRIDTDPESLFLVDETETGKPSLDPILKKLQPNRPKEPRSTGSRSWHPVRNRSSILL